jgi:hypothetical protein
VINRGCNALERVRIEGIEVFEHTGKMRNTSRQIRCNFIIVRMTQTPNGLEEPPAENRCRAPTYSFRAMQMKQPANAKGSSVLLYTSVSSALRASRLVQIHSNANGFPDELCFDAERIRIRSRHTKSLTVPGPLALTARSATSAL